jgi:hypothetical protein
MNRVQFKRAYEELHSHMCQRFMPYVYPKSTAVNTNWHFSLLARKTGEFHYTGPRGVRIVGDDFFHSRWNYTRRQWD